MFHVCDTTCSTCMFQFLLFHKLHYLLKKSYFLFHSKYQKFHIVLNQNVIKCMISLFYFEQTNVLEICNFSVEDRSIRDKKARNVNDTCNF